MMLRGQALAKLQSTSFLGTLFVAVAVFFGSELQV